jgi:hypothetical protein
MPTTRINYFTTYRSLKLNRDARGVPALEGASAAGLVNATKAKSQPVCEKGAVA